MKRSKFTKSQIAFILRQGEEGTPTGEVCRKAGITSATAPTTSDKNLARFSIDPP
jgi:hypothetical protein